MQVQARNRSTFELAWALWRRRKWLAIVMFAMAYSAALSLVSALPDLYRATATVLVKQDQVPESFIRSSVAGETETRLHAISQQILSRSRLQDLIARFDLYPELRKRAFPEVVIARMRRDVQLEFKGVEQKWGRTATIAFNLSYQGWDPQTVAQVTNTLVSFYVAENETIRERLAARTSEFLKDRLGEVEKKQ
ncbi:MAG: lipopolysaccharide biosynthesis protein, partial [Candidatus Tectomicrobia bacterium]|nr:lipopolysaccharide biosynthesis protein [Candidatus Tectomicrobia bacterium]